MTFSTYPLWLNALLFLISAAIIWWASSRLERHAVLHDLKAGGAVEGPRPAASSAAGRGTSH